MGQETVGVVARFKIRADKLEEFVALCREGLVEPSRKEPGCISYDLWQDRQDPTRFAMVEQWQSEQALAAHLALPAQQAVVAKLVPLGDGAIEMQRFAPL